jgi:hypothetical protein
VGLEEAQGAAALDLAGGRADALGLGPTEHTGGELEHGTEGGIPLAVRHLVANALERLHAVGEHRAEAALWSDQRVLRELRHGP